MNSRTPPVHLVGGRLCLDFLNTANWTAGGKVAEEKLVTERELEIWCRAIGLNVPPPLAGSLGDLRNFRARLRRIFLSVLRKEEPAADDLTALNKALRHPAPLVSRPGGITYGPEATLEQIIATSATAVLTAKHEMQRVKSCPGDDCGWLFLDETKNQRRSWCSMELCGNRAKARRHYQRHAASKA